MSLQWCDSAHFTALHRKNLFKSLVHSDILKIIVLLVPNVIASQQYSSMLWTPFWRGKASCSYCAVCCILTFVSGKHSNTLILLKLMCYNLVHKGHVYTSRRVYLSRKQGKKNTVCCGYGYIFSGNSKNCFLFSRLYNCCEYLKSN